MPSEPTHDIGAKVNQPKERCKTTKVNYGSLAFVRVSEDGRYLQVTDPATYHGCNLLINDRRSWRASVRKFVDGLR